MSLPVIQFLKNLFIALMIFLAGWFGEKYLKRGAILFGILALIFLAITVITSKFAPMAWRYYFISNTNWAIIFFIPFFSKLNSSEEEGNKKYLISLILLLSFLIAALFSRFATFFLFSVMVLFISFKSGPLKKISMYQIGLILFVFMIIMFFGYQRIFVHGFDYGYLKYTVLSHTFKAGLWGAVDGVELPSFNEKASGYYLTPYIKNDLILPLIAKNFGLVFIFTIPVFIAIVLLSINRKLSTQLARMYLLFVSTLFFLVVLKYLFINSPLPHYRIPFIGWNPDFAHFFAMGVIFKDRFAKNDSGDL
ncbi:MAG: hypothetical protein SCALA702_28120 [Melioribacteraceae bacterium]|nr:MAG: hypothetical protein SCALA702_28120 [Melioribacteraceae bacterium]